MVNLGLVHYVYVAFIALIIIVMFLKKDVILPCILGILVIGFIYSGNIISSVQIIYRSVVVSSREFIEIVIIIALVNSMSKALNSVGADEVMIRPISKLMISPKIAFVVLGFTMMIFSWFIWPTPAIAFIGPLMVPAAIRSGLEPVWAAVSLDIFGNGIALSSDYFIQGAPAITSKAAGIESPFAIVKAGFFMWLTISAIVVAISIIMMNRNGINKIKNTEKKYTYKTSDSKSKIVAMLTYIFFLIDIVILYFYKLKGNDATSLIGGTAVIVMLLCVLIKNDIKASLGEVTTLIRDGFMFSIKIFAPIIIIGAFFFLGSKETAQEILGLGTNGLLTDVGVYISQNIKLNKFSVVLIQSFISGLLGVGGSGFSGLPLIGTLAQVFSKAININKASIAALGQIITIWVGGGTIIPWSIIPSAAICEVEPFEVVKRNIIPVACGIISIVLIAMFML
ncbi:hypothetical protein SAMN02745134_01759 [Clostridium acidisoli DSM 12555]|uniref:TRAP C4-dicarboxylate transport system permease DctM subunit domain-containing protein n=1 Tax=Clostridium acidisoli DSM 12555 TaxID=1121291 RepID=A0A1W1XHE4_9CLOT|nr:TRAP transporter large permease subunit [Clostridium acidisoli]SMC22918.1 hypothetical protein SAMN02745134_01759 [Clostridium acidisoli DSM 12555]